VYTNTNTDHLGIHLFNDVYQRRKRGCREQRRFRYFDDVEYCVEKSIKRVGTRVMETASANMAVRRRRNLYENAFSKCLR
jgi:hypothetical protein